MTTVAATFADVYRSKYVLLTTFTKDGRPKPTAVRGTPADGKLLVFTGSDSWKVKRIRTNSRVRISACDMRGRPTSDGVEAIATLLDASGTERVYAAIRQHYGRGGWLYALFTKLGGGLNNRVGLQISAVATRTNV